MNTFLSGMDYFGVAFSLLVYFFMSRVQNRCPVKGVKPLLNPMLLTVLLTIGFLLATGISYETFNLGAQYITWFLAPTTVSLAIPLYEKVSYLKKEPVAILTGILAGVIVSAVSILGMAVLFGISQTEYITLLPKSVTAAVGMDLSDSLGGYQAITMASITITGVLGNVTASYVFKFLRITDPVAQGIALGTAAHAMGTSRASELGKIQEAMSSLAMGVAGLMTVFAAAVFAAIPV